MRVEHQCNKCSATFERQGGRYTSWLCPPCLKEVRGPAVRSARKTRQMQKEPELWRHETQEEWLKRIDKAGRA